MKERILLLHCDGTQSLPIARSIKKMGFVVDGVFCSKLTYGYGSSCISKKFMFHGDMKNLNEYFLFIMNILSSTSYRTIIPLNDESAEMLSVYQSQLKVYTEYKMPTSDTFAKGYDKHLLMEICQENGYPHPQTTVVHGDSLSEINLDKLDFPLLIKPNYTCGGRGMTYVDNKEDLKNIFPQIYKSYGECHLQTFIPAGGAQVEVQLYVDESGNLLNSSVIYKYRWYPENGGSSCCNKSIQNDKIVKTCHQILNKIGWVGFADFDTIENPQTHELLIMELNPRVPACVRTAMEAGIDWGKIIINQYLNLPDQKTYQYNKEVYLRHLGFETLWFLYSKNRFKTYPNWFKLIGSNIYYQDLSWKDIIPFILGTIGNIKKQLSPSFRKSKAGLR